MPSVGWAYGGRFHDIGHGHLDLSLDKFRRNPQDAPPEPREGAIPARIRSHALRAIAAVDFDDEPHRGSCEVHDAGLDHELPPDPLQFGRIKKDARFESLAQVAIGAYSLAYGVGFSVRAKAPATVYPSSHTVRMMRGRERIRTTSEAGAPCIVIGPRRHPQDWVMLLVIVAVLCLACIMIWRASAAEPGAPPGALAFMISCTVGFFLLAVAGLFLVMWRLFGLEMYSVRNGMLTVTWRLLFVRTVKSYRLMELSAFGIENRIHAGRGGQFVTRNISFVYRGRRVRSWSQLSAAEGATFITELPVMLQVL